VHGEGRSTRRRRDDKNRLKALWRREGRPCIRCGQPIDYSLPWNHPDAVTEEHIMPWSTHPDLRDEVTNKAPAHAACNKSGGNRGVESGLGTTGQVW